MFKLDLEKAEEPELKLPISRGRTESDMTEATAAAAEISSRKLEIPREHFMKRWAQYRTEMVGT